MSTDMNQDINHMSMSGSVEDGLETVDAELTDAPLGEEGVDTVDPELTDMSPEEDDTTVSDADFDEAAPHWDSAEIEAFEKEDKTKYFFGFRKLSAFDDSSVLIKRLKCNIGYSKVPDCFRIMDEYLTEDIGKVSAIQLRHLWRIAHGEDAAALLAERAELKKKGKKHGAGLNDYAFPLEYHLSRSEWERDMGRMSHYLSRKRPADDASRPAVMSEVWSMSEIEFESVFLERSSKVVTLMQLALLADARQNERLEKEWSKIEHYLYKVPLEKSRGGIFSDSDAHLLRFFGIYHLNDLRRYSVYRLKNMLLEHDFTHIVEEINAAYKEDLARKRDIRYKVIPFVFGFIALAICGFLCYDNKYTLLKNFPLTIVIMVVLGIWLVTVPTILGAGLRAIRRRKTKKDYVYFTKRVKRTCVLYLLCAVVIVLGTAVCYERYDGYDDNYFYRDLDDGTIAVAGLFNQDLTEVSIPETIDGKTVTEIDIRAFFEDKITAVELPDTVKKIDQSAFEKCGRLEQVSLSQQLTEIGKKAFAECDDLNSIDLPSTLETLGEAAFANTGLYSLDLSSTSLTVLPEGAFESCTSLETVAGLDKVTVIRERAFAECSYLKSISFSGALTTIGKEAFYSCSSLKTLVVPVGVKNIGDDAFSRCGDLEKVTLPFIGNTLEDDGKLYDIMNPEGIGTRATSLTITKATAIDGNDFKKCNWIEELILPKNVTSIAESAFTDMDSLASITLNENITEIKASTFKNCYLLSTVNGAEAVSSVGKNAFEECNSLESISLPALVTMEPQAFLSAGLRSFVMAQTLTSIPERAFENCNHLETVTWAEKLTTIGDNAFTGCSSLKELIFPENLVNVGKNAFEGCANVSTIIFTESMTNVHKNAFNGLLPDKVEIPEALLPQYKSMFAINFDTVITESPSETPSDTAEEPGNDSGASEVMEDTLAEPEM